LVRHHYFDSRLALRRSCRKKQRHLIDFFGEPHRKIAERSAHVFLDPNQWIDARSPSNQDL